jgi:hypothetical protein
MLAAFVVEVRTGCVSGGERRDSDLAYEAALARGVECCRWNIRGETLCLRDSDGVTAPWESASPNRELVNRQRGRNKEER